MGHFNVSVAVTSSRDHGVTREASPRSGSAAGGHFLGRSTAGWFTEGHRGACLDLPRPGSHSRGTHFHSGPPGGCLSPELGLATVSS